MGLCHSFLSLQSLRGHTRGEKRAYRFIKDEASVYFNVITVESMISGVKNVQHQNSMYDYKVLPVSFNISFCYLAY